MRNHILKIPFSGKKKNADNCSDLGKELYKTWTEGGCSSMATRGLLTPEMAGIIHYGKHNITMYLKSSTNNFVLSGAESVKIVKNKITY